MKKESMYFDVDQARIHKSIYRPSTNPVRFVKALFAVLLLGNSPINTNLSKRRIH